MIGDGLLIDGKYRVVRQIGQGGMGAVYEAVHDGTGRRVALKVILDATLAADNDMVVRFQREARAAGAIDTQHIVQVFDTGCDPTTKNLFMVMEYLAGEDISHVVKRIGPLPPEVALRIAAQAATGLQKAHDAGVIHRDIKPANLYLARREAGELLVKVLDFGIAKVTMDKLSSMENAALTRTGNMLGSPLYMSPEQAKGLRTVNHQTDVWSLGVVLYETLCGRTPNADVESLGQLIIAICSEPPRPIQEVAPWVQPEIASIIHRALQIDTARRFASMAEMLDAMRAVLPHGSALSEPMISALAPQVRAYVAPKLAISQRTTVQHHQPHQQGTLPLGAEGAVSGRPNVPTVPGMPEGRMSVPMSGTPAPTSHATPNIMAGLSRASSTLDMAGAHAISQAGVTGSSRDLGVGPRPSTSRAPLVIGSLLVLSILTGGVVIGARKYKSAHQPTVEAPIATSGLAATTTTTPSSVVPAASAASPSTADTHATRTVRLAVAPANVNVEVDGVKVDVVDGMVPIEGVLGSVHKVRLSSGKKEMLREVFLTEVGPRPEKVELGVSVVATTTTATQATVLKPTPTGGQPANSSRVPEKGIDRGTGEFK